MNPCFYCKAFVDESSKHCRPCNRCTIGFDHHCKWLNNCVGQTNYKTFILFVMAVLGTLTVHFAVILYQFIASFLDHNFFDDRVKSLYPSLSMNGWRTAIAITGLAAAITLVLLLHLFGFHIMMAIRGETTYGWIVKRRKKKNREQQQSTEPDEEMPQAAATSNTPAGEPSSSPSIDAGVAAAVASTIQAQMEYTKEWPSPQQQPQPHYGSTAAAAPTPGPAAVTSSSSTSTSSPFSQNGSVFRNPNSTNGGSTTTTTTANCNNNVFIPHAAPAVSNVSSSSTSHHLAVIPSLSTSAFFASREQTPYTCSADFSKKDDGKLGSSLDTPFPSPVESVLFGISPPTVTGPTPSNTPSSDKDIYIVLKV
jgi:hypothetical protein